MVISILEETWAYSIGEIIHSIKATPSCEAKSFSATVAIPSISRKPQVHYCVTRSNHLYILIQINPVYSLIPFF
jgi:hypothetical protein